MRARDLLVAAGVVLFAVPVVAVMTEGSIPPARIVTPLASASPPTPFAVPEVREATPKVVRYRSCTALRKAHPRGVSKGHPAYRRALDRDRDGRACEPS